MIRVYDSEDGLQVGMISVHRLQDTAIGDLTQDINQYRSSPPCAYPFMYCIQGNDPEEKAVVQGSPRVWVQ